MAISPVSQSTSFKSGWKPAECTNDRIGQVFIEKTQSLLIQADERKRSYLTDSQVLEKGFWYQNEYFVALREMERKTEKSWSGVFWNWMYPTKLDLFKRDNTFYHGYPPEGFSHVADTSSITGKRVISYVLEPGQSAVQGLANLREKFSLIDCQTLLEIALYEVLLEVLGEERFNRCFQADGPDALKVDRQISETPLEKWMKTKDTKKGSLNNRPVRKGEAAYFGNVPIYTYKHPEEDLGGFHVVCMEGGAQAKFLAFGLSSEGASEIGIIDHFIAGFQAEPLSAKEMYTASAAAAIERTKQLTNLPPGMSAEEFRKAASQFHLNREVFKITEDQLPDRVGYVPRVSSLNCEKIIRELKKPAN
jgi:hypothetical protein